MEFTELERAVLSWISEHNSIPNLKQQIESAVPTGREFTGVGSFTTLSVPRNIAPIPPDSTIDAPIIVSEGVEDDGSAIIFRSSSHHIETLEMVANGDRFDEDITGFELIAWEESNNGLRDVPS